MRPGPDGIDHLALIPDAALEIDERGVLVDANGRAIELFGCERANLLGQPIDRYLPDGELLRPLAPGHRRMNGRRHSGVPVVLDVSAQSLVTEGGRRTICSLREVNDDRLAGEVQLYFDVAFDSAPVGKALFNCDGEYVRVNAALCELLGRTADDLIGRRDQELTHPDDRQADVEVAWEILEGKYDTHQCEKRFVRPDGAVVWASAHLTFVRDEERRPLGWFGQFQDITARRAAEEALRASEERHRLVVRNLPGTAVVLYDRELRCTLMEGRHMEHAGVEPSELVGRPMREIVPPDLAEVLEPAARRALAGEPTSIEADSSLSGRVLSAEVVPHRDLNGEVAGALVCLRDVTAQRAAEQATREAEHRFRLAFDHAPIGIALVTPDGGWLRVNDRLCQMLGYSSGQLLARGFQHITHPDDLPGSLERLEAMRRGELDSFEAEKRYLRADGRPLWVILSVSVVRDAAGDPLYFISQIQDIDRRKQAERELDRLAHHDPLTGLPNRRAWDEALSGAIDTAHRTGHGLAVALLDINRFKQVNDTRGHIAGDRLLVEAAAAWGAQLREGDLLCRIGGDEFALLLPDADEASAGQIAQRLKEALRHQAGCAIGLSVFRPGMDAAELMRVADAALYGDKPGDQLRPRTAA